jgi:death on curing protein
MNEPIWLEKEAVVHLQSTSLAWFGGSAGIRDEGLLDSAQARPVNLFPYKGGIDLADLAASYAFGLAKNHPFVDGNKRAAFLACGVFLDINGLTLNAAVPDSIAAMQALASGTIGGQEFAAWIRSNLR